MVWSTDLSKDLVFKTQFIYKREDSNYKVIATEVLYPFYIYKYLGCVQSVNKALPVCVGKVETLEKERRKSAVFDNQFQAGKLFFLIK